MVYSFILINFIMLNLAINKLNLWTSYCDVPASNKFNLWSGIQQFWNNLGFQDPATPLMEGLITLHADIWGMMLFILGFVLSMLFISIYRFNAKITTISYKLHHHSVIEIIWTIVPAIMLVFIAIPSFALLYTLDELLDPAITVKAVGKQWFWYYEFTDYELENGSNFGFDSNLLQDDDLSLGQLRLLDVDFNLVLPTNTPIRLLTTAGDVIHSFAVPSLGIKLDAIPGRLNQTMLFIKRQGVFYGQCSELCGSGHGMMPIVVEAVHRIDYAYWIDQCLKNE